MSIHEFRVLIKRPSKVYFEALKWQNVRSGSPRYPTDTFTILRPQNQWVKVLELHKICRLTVGYEIVKGSVGQLYSEFENGTISTLLIITFSAAVCFNDSLANSEPDQTFPNFGATLFYVVKKGRPDPLWPYYCEVFRREAYLECNCLNFNNTFLTYQRADPSLEWSGIS